MAFRSGFSDKVLLSALDRQKRLEEPVATQTAGFGTWPVGEQGFRATGQNGDFATRLAGDKKFAGSIRFWNDLHNTGNFGAPANANPNGGTA